VRSQPVEKINRLLEQLPNLTDLYVMNVPVRGDFLSAFIGCPKIKQITIASMSISDEVIVQFQQARPDVALTLLGCEL